LATCTSPDGYTSHESTWNGIHHRGRQPRQSLVNEPVARQRDDDRHDAGALIFASAGTDRAVRARLFQGARKRQPVSASLRRAVAARLL
jgi:hypothetical protein